MGTLKKELPSAIKTTVGCLLFGLGFNLFLLPVNLNSGGLTGLSMLIWHITGVLPVGVISAIINIPLFLIARLRIGKRFFFGSLFGMIMCAAAIDLLALLPKPELDPLLCALYGGVFCGFGLGLVFSTGYSTGGSDIIVRFIKYKWPNQQIGTLNICFDLCIAVLTGIAFRDFSRALYSGVSIVITGVVVDAVVYRFDYSKVAIIISSKYQELTAGINQELDRGATLLHGEGGYTHRETKVILTVVRKQQLAELKQLVVRIDPDAFIIVQEAHQVLGDGFSRYSKDAL